MAPQTRRRITPSGYDPYVPVRAAPGRCARLGLGHPRRSRQLPINHLNVRDAVADERFHVPGDEDGVDARALQRLDVLA